MSDAAIPDADRDSTFVQVFVQTNDPVAACIRAQIRDYRYDIREVARRQLARPEIQAAIAAVKKLMPSKEDVEITLDSIVADLEHIHQEAVSDRDYTPAIAAKKLQAQMRGYLQENINITHTMRVEDMSNDELKRFLKKQPTIDGEFTAAAAPLGLGFAGDK